MTDWQIESICREYKYRGYRKPEFAELQILTNKRFCTKRVPLKETKGEANGERN